MLEVWYTVRLVFYQKRKDFKLQNICEQIAQHKNRIKFIRACLDKTIIYEGVPKHELYRQMDEIGRKGL